MAPIRSLPLVLAHVLALVPAVVLAFAPTPAAAQESASAVRSTLFRDADAALAAANEARANLLAPESYRRGAELYRRASERLERGRSVESIREDLDRAEAAFKTALEAAELAELTLADAIAARADALAAEAPSYAPELWEDAEQEFSRAANRLESGSLRSARAAGEEATGSYRAAELTAIKSNYLDEARGLIAEARDERVERYAPATLARAEGLLTEAEQSLTENRYDTDRPRTLAAQAKYEASHALWLASRIREAYRDAAAVEALLLENERALARVGDALDLDLRMDQGLTPPAERTVEAIEALQSRATAAEQVVLELQAQVQELEVALGGTSERAAAMQALRERLTEIENLFGPTEARVLREGPDVILRMVGLTFPTGEASIPSAAYGLLGKLEEALSQFPEQRVVVEGHTDAFGSDEANMALSLRRAQAVRDYLLANVPALSPPDVRAMGYGEARPIANNETAEGRARNRRIDVVLEGALASGLSP